MKRLYILFLSIFLVYPVFSQVEDDLDVALEDGDFFFLDEDYQEAIFYYLKLVDTDRMNENIQYKIGVCYLNIPGEEHNAIPFLEKAIQNTAGKYRERFSDETRAPAHAYFYLARAYHYNNELDKALDMYNRFKALPEFEGNYNVGMVDAEITACEKAKIIQDIPISLEYQDIGDPVNTQRDNYYPVISKDESFLVYMSELAFYDGVFTSRKIEGKWSEPNNITPQIESDGDVVPTCLSADGKELYLVKGEGNNRDVYISRLVNGVWTKMERLNDNVNSNRAESHASISSDGKTLYFTSNRRGGVGELDIWKSERLSSGDWGPAVNLGRAINTEFDEESPYLTGNDTVLVFSSRGHYNMGNFDIFYATKLDDNTWSVPTNIGFPLNTTGDDYFYVPAGGMNRGYMARKLPEGAGGMDIYRYEILPEEEEEIVPFTGIIDSRDLRSTSGKDFEITVTDKMTGMVIAIIRYDSEKGVFTYETPYGNYSFSIKEE
jgi:hypothetical protein